MSLIMLLLLGNPFSNLLSNPPRDLASLLEPAVVLQKLDVKITDDALLNVLKAKAEAAPADADAGDVLYVKKLMAIRLLEQTKSQNALPALQEIAKGSDVTLRDAAQEAIAAISGKPNPRPSGATLLKDIARSLPPDAGFVVVLDMERDSKATTIGAFMETAMKEAEAKGFLNPPPGNSMAPEQAAQMKAQFQAMTAQAEDGIIHVLAQTGNIRIDAATVVASADFGLDGDNGCFGFVFKGLYDPDRVTKLLKQRGMEEREIGGRKVFFAERNSMPFCLLDANTLVTVGCVGSKQSAIMEKFLRTLTAAEMKTPTAALATAFDLVTEKKARVAASGSLTQPQKDFIRAELAKKAADAEPVEAAGRAMYLSLIQAVAYNAALDTQGKLTLQAVFAGNEAAAALGDAATKLQQVVRDRAVKEAETAPPPFRAMLDPLLKGGALWQTEVAENRVTLKLDNPLSLFLMR